MKSQVIRTLSRASQKHAPQNRPVGKRIFIGLSGGVDSSVSAALLQMAGYDVTGVFIKVWQPDWLECTWKEECRDAMRAAAHLGIRFVTLDLEKEYRRDVVDYMLTEYRAGRTPNPDVMCNKTIKFGAFYDWAMKRGANYIATGHYAQIRNNSEKEALHLLRAAIDSNKDQSYFLWTLKSEQLPHILFPIGHLTKPEVRKLAMQFKLPTAEKKDSQGICFIGMVNMKTFLSHYIESNDGDVLNDAGKVIGKHSGVAFFTIGERRGFNITEKGPMDGAYYVVNKDMKKNTITVKEKREKLQTANCKLQKNNKTQVSIAQTNWVNGSPILEKKYQARSRYRQALENITFVNIDTNNASALVEFETTQETITAGQSLVVYDGDICMGGGIIS